MTNKAKHTPGPWEGSTGPQSRSDNYGTAFGRVTARNRHGVEVLVADTTQHHATSGLTTIANTALVAAAPDMLDALEAAEDFVVGCDGAQMIWEQIRKAIRKAKGE